MLETVVGRIGEEGDDDDADQEVVRDDDKDDDEEGRDDEHESDEETRDEESFDPIPQTLEDNEDEGNDEEDISLNIGEAAPKPKASVKRTRSSSDTSITPSTTAASPRLTTSVKGKQTAKTSKAKSLSALSKLAITKVQQLKLVTKRSKQQTHISQPSGLGTDEGTGSKPGVLDVPTQLKLVTKRSKQQTHISQPSGLGADEGTGSKPGVLDVPTDESEEELS
nr:hypothetical protein [Tanacetum cinerariifolium]